MGWREVAQVAQMKVEQALERAKQERSSLPESITVDNGSELCSSRALEVWTMSNDVFSLLR